MPGFKIRRAETINKDLGLKAIVDGYVNFPIHTYIENDYTPLHWDNDMATGSCPLVSKITGERYPKESSYDGLIDLRDKMAEPFAEDL